MEPTTTGHPTVSEPPSTDTDETSFKTPNAPPGRHFKQVVTPGLGGRPLVPEWLSKYFRRKDTPATR
ncbi:MAG TPA: hypothetical protein VMU55_08800 [Solirubrobacteraceae bacterium]|nr:hypothetical protein [Solirubrobacteraceae bacterium]